MNYLFSPIKIRDITLKNRIVVSPMCQYSSSDGFASDWHLVHLGSRAVGGAAMVMTEATAVSPEGRITPDDLGIWKDEHIPKLRQITSFISGQHCVPGIQLSHAGRKASTQSPWKGHEKVSLEQGGWQPLAPSAIGYSDVYLIPAELDKAGISQIITDFKLAAKRALAAGFRVVEVHAAHGYLLHQFLSPLTNQRMDEYGGCFENRARLLNEIVESVRNVWPQELPVFLRLSGTDWADGGWDITKAVQLAALMKGKGVDVVDMTTGGVVHDQQIRVGPGYQLPFASHIKKETGMLVATVGLITEAVQAETILANGDADLVMIAREMLRNPYFPLMASGQLKGEIVWPSQYERAKL